MFGELKAAGKEAERLRSWSREGVERAEDSCVGAAEWIDEQRGRSPRLVGIRTAPTPTDTLSLDLDHTRCKRNDVKFANRL